MVEKSSTEHTCGDSYLTTKNNNHKTNNSKVVVSRGRGYRSIEFDTTPSLVISVPCFGSRGRGGWNVTTNIRYRGIRCTWTLDHCRYGSWFPSNRGRRCGTTGGEIQDSRYEIPCSYTFSETPLKRALLTLRIPVLNVP